MTERAEAEGAEEAWSTERSARLYRVEGWGATYFGVNPQGHVTVRPLGGTPQPATLAAVLLCCASRMHGMHRQHLVLLLRSQPPTRFLWNLDH